MAGSFQPIPKLMHPILRLTDLQFYSELRYVPALLKTRRGKNIHDTSN